MTVDPFDLPRFIFSDETVEKRTHAAVRRKKENLHERARSLHLHKPKLHAPELCHLRVIPPDHVFELPQGEFLLHATGSIAISAGKIRRPKRGELIVHDEEKFVRGWSGFLAA